MTASSKCRPRKRAGRFRFTISTYQIRNSYLQQIHFESLMKDNEWIGQELRPLLEFNRAQMTTL
jgi:hypothetical protein